MKEHKSLMSRFAAASALESEPIPGLPLVEIVGNERVLIENHAGVLLYNNNEIHVKVKHGHIIISGALLDLQRMSKEQLVITGQIAQVSVCNRRQA